GIRTDLPVAQPEHVDLAATSPLVGRAELTVDVPVGRNGFVQGGVIAAGWLDGGAATHDSIGIVVCKINHIGEKPECEIQVCVDLAHCVVFESFTASGYREVLGVVAAGWQMPGGASLSIGAQPFIGQ